MKIFAVLLALLATLPLAAEKPSPEAAQPAIKVKPSNELAIFAPDETVSFTLEASPGDTAGLTCKIVDWDGKAIPIPEGKEAKKASLPPGSLENGYYELIVLRYGAEVSRKSFAVIPKPDANIDPSKNQFGAMVIPHTAYPLADRETDAKFMERIGIRWVRTHRLNWIHVQKAPDKPFDWREADAEMEIYKRHKLDVVATCGWPCPPWASSGNPHGVIGAARGNMTPEAKFQPQLERFYTELAKRYAGRVAYYEIGNEVDANNFWLGSYESWASGSKDAIMKDYCKYFLLCAKALKAGDPEAKVAPNTTGAAEGHSYKPWLETMCKEGIGEEMNSFSTHYMADLPAIRKTLAKYGKGDIDIILTEIGGFVRSEREKLSPAELESSIRTSYTHFAAQLNAGGKALCKFLLREIPGVNNPDHGGMLDKDFSIRPELVAFATMARLLAGADPVKELNITRSCDKGWLQAYAFERGGKPVNVIILQDADSATAVLDLPGVQNALVTDVMGRERLLPVVDSKLSLPIKGSRPLFVSATIKDAPGEARHPEPVVVEEKTLSLRNPSFEAPSANGKIAGWTIFTDEKNSAEATPPAERFNASLDSAAPGQGGSSLRFEAKHKTEWYGAFCKLPLDQFPRPGPGQTIELEVSYMQKMKDVKGIGAGINIAFRRKDFSRIVFSCGNWEHGSSDWSKMLFKTKIKDLPKETAFITLEPTLGKSTGTVWFDDFKVVLRLWQASAAETLGVN